MKVVIITIIILVVFFAGALMFKDYVQTNSEKLLNQINRLDEALVQGDWGEAEARLKDIKEDWKEMKHILEVYIEHYDMDRAEVALAKINKYVESREKVLTLGEIAELKFVIDLIMKKEALKMFNLF